MASTKRFSFKFRSERRQKTESQIAAGQLAEDAINIAACFISEKQVKKRWKMNGCLRRWGRKRSSEGSDESSSIVEVLDEVERGKFSPLLKSRIDRYEHRRDCVCAENETEKVLVKVAITQISMLTNLREFVL